MDKKQTIYASLIGSKLIETVPRMQLVENELSKIVLPVLPVPSVVPFFSTQQNNEGITKSSADYTNEKQWQADARLGVNNQFFPLTFSRAGDGLRYQFPYEPLISISGGNSIISRKVAKAPKFIGTVKEYWCQDDYEITITGILMGSIETGSVEDCYPREQFERLKEFCTHPAGIEIFCEPLQLLGINRVVVKSFSFPFTKGENVQAYEIQCVSDFSADLLLEIE